MWRQTTRGSGWPRRSISDDPKLYERFSDAVHAGIINRNRPTTGASSALPFGGMGPVATIAQRVFRGGLLLLPRGVVGVLTLSLPAKPVPGIRF